MSEKTLAIVKPDGVKKRLIGEICSRYERAGFEVVALQMRKLSIQEAETFYEMHRGKPFFQSLTSFMSSGPIVSIVLQGEDVIARNRQLMGATNPKEAADGTIRKDFASNVEQNIVHGSDSKVSAEREVSFFFPGIELLQTRR